MPNVMHFPGKLEDTIPSNQGTRFHPFWGLTKRQSTMYGPDQYGAYYQPVRFEYQPLLDRTAVFVKPVVNKPKE